MDFSLSETKNDFRVLSQCKICIDHIRGATGILQGCGHDKKERAPVPTWQGSKLPRKQVSDRCSYVLLTH